MLILFGVLVWCWIFMICFEGVKPKTFEPNWLPTFRKWFAILTIICLLALMALSIFCS